MQQPAAQLLGDVMKEFGPIPHGSAQWPLVVMLPAFCPQITSIVPVLPTVPTRKCCAVYYLRSELFHGMEEVVGSIPTMSTKSAQQHKRTCISHQHLFQPKVQPNIRLDSRRSDLDRLNILQQGRKLPRTYKYLQVREKPVILGFSLGLRKEVCKFGSLFWERWIAHSCIWKKSAKCNVEL
jgi:hypothetical protein